MGGPGDESGSTGSNLTISSQDDQKSQTDDERALSDSSTEASAVPSHPLWPDIERITLEQLTFAQQGVGEGWEIFEQDGEMKLYKREKEVNGLVQDTLKAVHVVKGVTGFEMANCFFQPEYRFGWETTLEEMKIIEKVSDDAILFHQIHKRVWPASQRDAVFWSHIRQIPDSENPDGEPIWVVCNKSLAKDHPAAPDKKGKYTRAFLTAVIVCQTIITKHPNDEDELSRAEVTCKISYCSHVDPGGWVPAAATRAVYKREYPKFLRKFTSYVIDECQDKPVRTN